AEWTRSAEPAAARTRGAASSVDSTRSTPSGSGLRFPGRTIPRTCQPASRKTSPRCHPRKPVAPVMLTDRFFIDPIGFVTASAGRFDPGVDLRVVLERPRELGRPVAAGHRAAMALGDEQRVKADAARLWNHAEQQHAQLVDDRLLSQKMEHAER